MSNMPHLTLRQDQIFMFIKDRIAECCPPTVREIGEEFGISSPNGVSSHLIALEKKGVITREKGARNIRLVHPNGDKERYRAALLKIQKGCHAYPKHRNLAQWVKEQAQGALEATEPNGATDGE